MQTRSERQRNRMRIECAKLNEAVKKSAREDKRQFMEQLAETAEVTASKNEMRIALTSRSRSVEISIITESP